MNELDIVLKEYRNQIDTIDKEIVYLLSRRFEAVKSIGDIKKELGAQPLQQNRWQDVLDKLTEHSKEFGVNEKLVHEMYELIHKNALDIEK